MKRKRIQGLFPARIGQMRQNVAQEAAPTPAVTDKREIGEVWGMDTTTKAGNRVLSFVLALCLVLGMVVLPGPVTVRAAQYTDEFNIESGSVTIDEDGDYRIYGNGIPTINTITVKDGITANITLEDVAVDVSDDYYTAAFLLYSSATVKLTLLGENSLKSGECRAGLEVPAGAELEITAESSGKLKAFGGDFGAGIGGRDYTAGGKITIYNGEVTATSGYNGAGIGGGRGFAGGEVAIHGGTVTAIGNNDIAFGAGAGIGGGQDGYGGKVHITGGTVTATSQGDGAGIGGGDRGAGGEVAITGGTVTATSQSEGAGIGAGINSNTVGSLSIAGGSVWRTGEADKEASAKNEGGASLCLATLTVGETPDEVKSGEITGGNIKNSMGDYAYGLTDVFTDGDGKVYFWLPADNSTTATLEAAGEEYEGTLLVAANGSNVVTLAKKAPEVKHFVVSGNLNHTYTNNTLTVTGGQGKIAMADGVNETTHTIVVTGDADITLEDVAVDVSGTNDAAAFSIADGTKVELTLLGTNRLKSGRNRAGLEVPETAMLEITQSSTGELEAKGGDYGAGIGGGDYGNGGEVAIHGGEVLPQGGSRGAGIGGGDYGNGGTVTITGGTVAATGGGSGAGIGGGMQGNGGTVAIYGGTVTATGGREDTATGGGAGIGGGHHGTGGTLTITGGSVRRSGDEDREATATNGDDYGNASLYLATLTVGGTPDEVKSGEITGGSIRNSTGDYAYGLTDVFTDGDGKVYFWLPADNTTATLEAAGEEYEGTLLVAANGSNVVKLAKKVSQVEHFAVSGNLNHTYINNTLTIIGGQGKIAMADEVDETTHTIVVTGDADITLKDVSIDVSNIDFTCAFSIEPAAAVDLTLEGENTLKSGKNQAGLQVPGGAELTITENSTGSLEAYGGTNGAGIGGGVNVNGGTVNINGGTVIANSSGDGAGIGGGSGDGSVAGDGGTVTISGGTVIANSGADGAGIGGGGSNSGGYGAGDGGTVTISGGTVTANSSGDGAGIGGGGSRDGNAGNGGTVTISGGTVTAQGGSSGVGIGGGNGAGVPAPGSLTITGGSVRVTDNGGTGSRPAAENDQGTPLYLTTLTVGEGADEVKNDRITGGFVSSAMYYGFRDIVTDDNANVYFWLPADNTTATLEAAGEEYEGTLLVVANGSNVVTLAKKAPQVEHFAVSGNLDHTYIDNTLTITGGEGKISMADGIDETTHLIVVDGDADITLEGVVIDASGISYATAFRLEDIVTTNLTLTLLGETSLKSGWGRAGLEVPVGATLEITAGSTGKLETYGGDGGSGIGGGIGGNGGAVTIYGGTVTATGGLQGAGIGGGNVGNGGTVTITGGTVTATGGIQGAGIGGGNLRNGGIVTIYGGTVTATGGVSGAGIGGGNVGSGGTVTIYGGTVIATGGGIDGAGIGGYYGPGTLTITGGSVWRSGDAGYEAPAKNDSGESLYLATLTVGETPDEVKSGEITGGSIRNGTGDYAYGLNDVFTDDDGKVYFWLPADNSTTTLEVGNDRYRDSFTLTTGGISTVLKKVVAPRVASVAPSGTTVFPTENTLSVTFDKEMDTDIMGTVTLGGGAAVAFDQWENDSKTVLYTLSGLDYGKTYTVTVSGFKDTDGFIMETDNRHSFSTKTTPSVSFSLAGADSTAREGARYEASTTVSYSGDLPLTVEATGLPDGLEAELELVGGTYTLNISGTPQPGTARSSAYTVIITVSDGYVQKEDSFELTVNEALALTLADLANDTATEGESYSRDVSQAVTYNGNSADLEYSAGGLPEGLAMGSATGVISGTPDVGTAADSPYTVEVTVTNNDGLTQTKNFKLTVNEALALILADLANDTATEGESYNRDISEEVTYNGNLVDLEYSANGLPEGLEMVPDSGVISGTPDVGTANGSPYTVEVTVTNNDGLTQTKSFELTVNEALALTLADLANDTATEGESYSRDISEAVTYNGDPANLEYSASGLPDRLEIDSVTGIISGTPEAGTAADSPYTVTVKVTAGTLEAEKTFELTVEEALALTLGDLADDTATEGESYSRDISGAVIYNGDPADLEYSASGLPYELEIDSVTGIISGTPEAGTAANSPYTVTVKVTAGTLEAEKSFELTVEEALALTLGDLADDTATEGESYNRDISGAVIYNGDPADLEYSASGLPDELEIHSVTGIISGTPEAGTAANSPYAVTVRVTNNDGLTQTKSFELTVKAPAEEDTIAIDGISDFTVVAGQAYNIRYAVEYTGAGALTCVAENLPEGLEAAIKDNDTLIIGGTPSANAAKDAPYQVTVTVTDGVASHRVSFHLTVEEAPAKAALSIGNMKDITLAEGQAVELKVPVNYTGELTLGFSASGLPDGLELDPDSGDISGAPETGTANNTYRVRVSVTDGDLEDSTGFTVRVTEKEPEATLTIGEMENDTVKEGQSYRKTVPVRYTGGLTLGFSASGLPQGLEIDDDGVISGRLEPGTAENSPYRVTVHTSDGELKASRGYTLRVLRDGIDPEPEPEPGTYKVTVLDDGNGRGSASPRTAEEGQLVTLTAIPNDGYRFQEWRVVSGEAEISDASHSTATFRMPAEDVTVGAVFESTGGGNNGGSSSGSRDRTGSNNLKAQQKIQIPASAFSWDGTRTLTIDYEGITALGLLRVEWGGVETAAYSVYQGSVIIRFDEEFLEAQMPGTHSIGVEFLGHTGQTTIEVGNIPPAGESVSPAGTDGLSSSGGTDNPDTGGVPELPDMEFPWRYIWAMLLGCAVFVAMKEKARLASYNKR